jgi:hypothetical protein
LPANLLLLWERALPANLLPSCLLRSRLLHSTDFFRRPLFTVKQNIVVRMIQTQLLLTGLVQRLAGLADWRLHIAWRRDLFLIIEAAKPEHGLRAMGAFVGLGDMDRRIVDRGALAGEFLARPLQPAARTTFNFVVYRRHCLVLVPGVGTAGSLLFDRGAPGRSHFLLRLIGVVVAIDTLELFSLIFVVFAILIFLPGLKVLRVFRIICLVVIRGIIIPVSVVVLIVLVILEVVVILMSRVVFVVIIVEIVITVVVIEIVIAVVVIAITGSTHGLAAEVILLFVLLLFVLLVV